MPGDIVVRGNGENERFVINMLAQLYPGKSRFPDDATDGFEARQTAFTNCLLKMLCIQNLHSVAFPWKIGCCMAGGDWDTYLPMIENFSEKAGADVLIYRL